MRQFTLHQLMISVALIGFGIAGFASLRQFQGPPFYHHELLPFVFIDHRRLVFTCPISIGALTGGVGVLFERGWLSATIGCIVGFLLTTGFLWFAFNVSQA